MVDSTKHSLVSGMRTAKLHKFAYMEYGTEKVSEGFALDRPEVLLALLNSPGQFVSGHSMPPCLSLVFTIGDAFAHIAGRCMPYLVISDEGGRAEAFDEPNRSQLLSPSHQQEHFSDTRTHLV